MLLIKVKKWIIAKLLNAIFYLIPHKKKAAYIAGDEEFLTQDSIKVFRQYKRIAEILKPDQK